MTNPQILVMEKFGGMLTIIFFFIIPFILGVRYVRQKNLSRHYLWLYFIPISWVAYFIIKFSIKLVECPSCHNKIYHKLNICPYCSNNVVTSNKQHNVSDSPIPYHSEEKKCIIDQGNNLSQKPITLNKQHILSLWSWAALFLAFIMILNTALVRAIIGIQIMGAEMSHFWFMATLIVSVVAFLKNQNIYERLLFPCLLIMFIIIAKLTPLYLEWELKKKVKVIQENVSIVASIINDNYKKTGIIPDNIYALEIPLKYSRDYFGMYPMLSELNYRRENNLITIWSFGPDLKNNYSTIIYDPTNGTISDRDIVTKITLK